MHRLVDRLNGIRDRTRWPVVGWVAPAANGRPRSNAPRRCPVCRSLGSPEAMELIRADSS